MSTLIESEINMKINRQDYKFVPMTEMTDKLFQIGGWKNKRDFYADLACSYDDKELEDLTYAVHIEEFVDKAEFDALTTNTEKITMFIAAGRVYNMRVNEYFLEIM